MNVSQKRGAVPPPAEEGDRPGASAGGGSVRADVYYRPPDDWGMRWREYPVIPEDDERLASFRYSLDEGAARVLAYLTARRDHPDVDPDAATRLAVRVGTGLGRDPAIDALSTLEARGLVETTTVGSDARGRPPKGWVVTGDSDALRWRVRATHAEELLTTSAAVATALPDDWPDEGAVPAGEGVTTDSLELALNWTPNGLHAPLIAADGFGRYDDHGLAVTLDAARGSGAAIDRLVAEDADVAVAGAASLCLADDADLVPLALVHPRSLAVLYTTTERLGEPLDSVEQLRGRRLAVVADSEVGRLARLFLAQAGILDDVDIVPTEGEERDALVEGRADVATGMPTDPHELDAAGHEVHTLAVADHFPVPGPALVTRADVARRRPGVLARLLMGTVAGAATARREPERTAELVAERSGESVGTERWRLDSAHERADALDTDHAWGRQTVAGWERLRVALEQGVVG